MIRRIAGYGDSGLVIARTSFNNYHFIFAENFSHVLFSKNAKKVVKDVTANEHLRLHFRLPPY